MNSQQQRKQQKSKQPKTQTNRRRRIKRTAKQRVVKSQQKSQLKTIVSKCTREYASALVNPFGTRQVMPCIPDNIVLPSYKFQSKCRGVFSTGTLGAGFVSLNPFTMAAGDNALVGAFCDAPVVFTTLLYNQNNYGFTVAGGAFTTPGVSATNGNSQNTSAFLNAQGRQLRLVAAGLKIQYIGSMFRNQGRCVLYKQQGNANAPNPQTASGLLNDNYTVSVPVSRKAEYTFYTPDSHDLLNYDPYSAYVPSTGAIDRRSLVILVEGGDLASPQSFEFEATAYFEVVGPNLTLSASHADPGGQGAVLSSLPIKNPVAPPSVVEQSVFQRIVKELSEQSGSIASGVSKFAINQAMNYMNPSTLSYPTIEFAE